MSNTSFDNRVGRALKRTSTLALALGFAVMAPWAAGQAAAQATGTVTGTVTNQTTGAAVAGAQISIVGSEMGTLSNNVGRFICGGGHSGSLRSCPGGTRSPTALVIVVRAAAAPEFRR